MFSVHRDLCCQVSELCVCQVLVSAGANVDHADMDGWTALRAAAWGGHTEVTHNRQ